MPGTNLRYRILILLILATAVCSISLQLSRSAAAYKPFGADSVTIRDRKLSRFIPLIKNQKIIGYVDDRKLGIETLKEYYLTQYSLAPAIIQGGYKYPMVIGIFTKSDPAESLLKANNLVVVKNFGDGFFLLANRNEKKSEPSDSMPQ